MSSDLYIIVEEQDRGPLHNGNSQLLGARVTLNELSYEDFENFTDGTGRVIGVTLIEEDLWRYMQPSFSLHKSNLVPVMSQESI